MLSPEENRIQSQQLQNEDSNDGIAYNTALLKSNPGKTFDVLGKLLEFNNPNEFNSLIENINLENYTKIFNLRNILYILYVNIFEMPLLFH